MAEWVKFDLGKAVWSIPASRTKLRKQYPFEAMLLELGINHRYTRP
jgi:hypothetical protein